MKTLILFAVLFLNFDARAICVFPGQSEQGEKHVLQSHMMDLQRECAARNGIAIMTKHSITCVGQGEELKGLDGFTPANEKAKKDQPNVGSAASVYNYTNKGITFKGKFKSVSVGEECRDIDASWSGVLKSGPIEGNVVTDKSLAKPGFYWNTSMPLPKKSLITKCKEYFGFD